MTERENRQAQSDAVRRSAKAPSTSAGNRIGDALRRYLTAHARRMRGTGVKSRDSSGHDRR